MMRSAWIKWARGVEHQQVLARESREFDFHELYDYDRIDNERSGTDPLVEVEWRLKVLKPFPERWSVEIGDALTNLRAALDHTFWAAVLAHSGPPPNPHRVMFPLATANDKSFKATANTLRPMVSPDFWGLVEKVQPFQQEQPLNMPLEWLRWLSNADKHRAVRVLSRMAVDAGPITFIGDEEYETVEEKRFTGPVEDNGLLALLKFRRPMDGREVRLLPRFAYSPSLQVGDDPEQNVPLHVVMDAMSDHVLAVICEATTILGEQLPDPDSLEVGAEHAAVAAENAGIVATFRDYAGAVHHVSTPADGSAPPSS